MIMRASSTASLVKFRRLIWSYYRAHGRAMPWRARITPYRITVSEIMLQQTQVERVTKKFPEFIAAFPDFRALAYAPLPRVLRAWQGMGYNRRAVSLTRIAERVLREFGGRLPRDPAVLESLPGIGHATANSIAAFAFNAPVAFIETNIRRVFIHHFFPNRKNVSDKEIMPLIEAALDHTGPREWYWALMDYGAMLGRELGRENPNRRSVHYVRQPKFEGSVRQVRGAVLKQLIRKSALSVAELRRATGARGTRLKKALAGLAAAGLVRKIGARYRIKNARP